MAKRPVPAQELAAVASRFNGTPVDNNPRAFKFPDTAAFDAWNKSVDRLEAGETLDAVLGNKPSSSTTGSAPLDAAVGFIGGLMHQVLDPAIDASRALLPGGWGVEAAAERLTGDKQALTNNDIYKKSTYIPETTAGTLGSYLPVLAGTALGVATEGAIPTLATLGGAVGAQKASEATAGYIAGQPTFNLTPEQIESWRRLAGTAGMVAGGAAAHKMTPKVTIPEAVEAVKQSRQALADSAKRRAAGAIVIGKQGFESAGYPGLAAGTIAGAVKPELVDLTKQRLVNIARGEVSQPSAPTAEPRAPKPVASPRGPKPTPTLELQRQKDIASAIQWASDAKTKEQLRFNEADAGEKVLRSGIEAAEANGVDIDPVVLEQYNRSRKEIALADLPSLKERGEKLASRYSDAKSVAISESPKKDYLSVKKVIEGYADAGEQPPTELVNAHDLLRERALQQERSISIDAHDAAIQTLSDAATKGPTAYDAARASIDKNTLAAIERGPDRYVLETTKRLSRRLNGSQDNPVSNATLDALRESTRPTAARDANLEIVDKALDHAFGMADVSLTYKEASEASRLYRSAIDVLQSEETPVPDALTKGLARAEERLRSTAKGQPATVEDPLLAQRNDIVDTGIETARRLDAIGNDENLMRREIVSSHRKLSEAIDAHVAMDMPVPDVVSRQFQRLDNILQPAEVASAEAVPENAVLASRQKTEARLSKLASDLENVRVSTNEAGRYLKQLKQLQALFDLQGKPVAPSVVERIDALDKQVASAKRSNRKQAQVPEKTETPAQIRVRQRSGGKLSTPKVEYSPEVVQDGIELQRMADKYYAQQGLIGGEIDSAFMQRFKTLAHRVLGEENQKKFTFDTARTTPNKAQLNGALWNMFSWMSEAERLEKGFRKN